MPIRFRNNSIRWIIAILIIVIPSLLLFFITPSHKKLQERKCLKAGTIKTSNNNVLEIYLVWGDVFLPKLIHKDMGFDLVGVSCYFDPIVINKAQILPSNPMLNSAIEESLGGKEEIGYLLEHIILTLNQSRLVVASFMRGDKRIAGEGDQIVPYTWHTYGDSKMVHEQGIKYISALPLFNPDLLYGQITISETRQRLSENVETIIRRLIDFASDGLSPTVHSIALPAIGSTSHRAGDSEYFMTFTEGFISILKGIEESRPNEYLDRIYLVAYDQHMGLFKDDVLNALQDVKKYLFLKNIVRNQIKFVIAGILTILYTVFCITSYQNYREILKHNNRWQFMRTILFFSAFAMSISWGASLILFEAFSLSIEMFLSLYIIFTILTLFGINWLGKNSIF